MAVTYPNYSQDYPEFNPQSFRTHAPSRPARNARTGRARRAVRNVEGRVRRAKTRQGSLVGGLLRSRLMDDLCAVMVVGGGIFFLLAVARMLMTP